MTRVGGARAYAVLAAVALANLLVAVLHFGLAASAPLLRARFDLDDASLGVLLAAPPFGLMLGTFAWGVLADSRDERHVMTGAFVLCAGAVGVTAAAGAHHAVLALGAGLFVAGLSGSAAHSAGGRAIAASFPPNRHGTVLAIRHTAIPIGATIGALLLPAGIDGIGFGATVGMLAVATLIAAAVLWFALADVAVPRFDGAHAHTPSPSPLRSGRLWLLGGGCASLAFVQLGLASFLTVYLVDETGHRIATAAVIFAAAQLVGAAGRLALGVASDRVPERVTVLQMVAALGCGAMVLAAVLGGSNAGAVLLVATLALTTMWNGVAVAVAAALAAHDRIGATLGMQTTMNAAACTVAPIIIGATLHVAGWRQVELLLAVMLGLSFTSFAVLRCARVHEPR